MGRQECPNHEELSAFRAGNLPSESFESVAEHVETCAQCLAALECLPASKDPLLSALGAPVSTDAFSQETKCREVIDRLASALPEAVVSNNQEVIRGNPLAGNSVTTSTDEEHTTDERVRPAGPQPLPQIPGYVVARWIGGGGMGDVFEAINLLGLRFALKVIRSDLGGPDLRARFRKEAAALQSLDHPNVARIFEYNEVDGAPFFTMRLLTGGTLAARSAEYRADHRRAVSLLATVAGAVGYLHRRKLLHRDLKPSNILFDDEGRPFISDFGLVKDLTPLESAPLRDDAVADTSVPQVEARPGSEWEAALTATGWLPGTLQYMSPEQVRAEQDRIGPWSDVWALGVILYELLTGSRPFEAGDKRGLIAQIETTQPPAPRVRNPLLDETIEAIVLKCLAKRPEDRFPSADPLADALRDRVSPSAPPSQGEQATGRPVQSQKARRRFVRLAAVVVVLAAAAIGISLSLRHSEANLATAREKLARGEAVELIGARGLPKYNYYKVRSEPETIVFLARDGVLAVSAQRLGLVELLPDPVRDRYRFRVAVRQDTWLTPASRAGLYCLHQASNDEKGTLHHFVDLGVMEDDVDLKNSDPRRAVDEPGQRANRRLTAIACFLRKAGEPPVVNGNKLVGQLGFETDGPLAGGTEPWRELVVEVTPDKVRALFGNREVGLIDRRGTLNSDWSWLSIRPAAPRGGLGVYVIGGSASFRFGVIEPLPDNQ
jgi:serine/threonine-protein kinase